MNYFYDLNQSNLSNQFCIKYSENFRGTSSGRTVLFVMNLSNLAQNVLNRNTINRPKKKKFFKLIWELRHRCQSKSTRKTDQSWSSVFIQHKRHQLISNKKPTYAISDFWVDFVKSYSTLYNKRLCNDVSWISEKKPTYQHEAGRI